MPPPPSPRTLTDAVQDLEKRLARFERILTTLIRCMKALWLVLAPPLVALLIDYFLKE